jgi:hypothetical protein
MFDLWVRVLVHNGGSPFYARDQKELLIEAGFERPVVTVHALTYGTAAETQRNAAGTRNVFASLARTAIAQRWVDDGLVEEICDDLVAWGKKPGAFGLTLWFSAVAWRR